MSAVTELAEAVPVERACESLSVPRASYYRWLSPEFGPRPKPKPCVPSLGETKTLHNLPTKRAGQRRT